VRGGGERKKTRPGGCLWPIIENPADQCKDLGFCSERNGKLRWGFKQENEAN
jgi:hypothetical protein